jgi:TetR/AcrR family transcriptional regulator, repressor for neighboring sulfatase
MPIIDRVTLLRERPGAPEPCVVPSPVLKRRAEPTRPRSRRTPEASRELILGAAKRLIRELPPDSLGLKSVAEAAGVSHALVTHYFGTIDALVNDTLESLAEENRRELMVKIGSEESSPREWLRQLFDWVLRPEAARLLAWSHLTGKVTRSDFFSKRSRGLRKVADRLEARFEGRLDVSRREVEDLLLLVMSASFGYAIGRAGFWGGLGIDKPTEQEDERFFELLAELVERRMAERVRR